MFLALGINIAGQKELLGMRLAENEGANFWFNVLTELKNRGLNDILIACVDGLKEFPEARIQLCIVHMVRNSMRFVSWKEYKAVTRDLKAISLPQKWQASRHWKRLLRLGLPLSADKPVLAVKLD